jgi:Asp-tRNA(Asn)/Glu-tRNA(Gln) amidotransferase B subunit
MKKGEGKISKKQFDKETSKPIAKREKEKAPDYRKDWKADKRQGTSDGHMVRRYKEQLKANQKETPKMDRGT